MLLESAFLALGMMLVLIAEAFGLSKAGRA
jgi:hypothetical protein